jgi:outer membrane murein-binding lipoprotein Lpp
LISSKQSLVFAAFIAACCLAGCASHPAPDQVAFVNHALAATDPAKMKALERGGAAEKEAIARFEAFNGDFSAANVTNNTRNVYSADLYFCDPFKVIRGEAAFETYLLRDNDAVGQYSIDWKDVAVSPSDYYFRWVMTLKFKRDPKNQPPSLTMGISQVRFGADGKVIFQQDYYDAAAFLYEKIPILGSEIRFIKNRL